MALAILDIDRAVAIAKVNAENGAEDPAVLRLMDQMADRKRSIEPDMTRFAMLCDHWDNLYWPQTFTAGGPSHWAYHESARLAGRSHVSLNVYPVYVDIPAALQSVEPVQQMLALGESEADRKMAAEVERVYRSWSVKTDFELKGHKACVTKGLYGRTAAKVYWDDDSDFPQIEIVDQPRNLYLGWRDSSYTRLEWALYTYRITPQTAMEDWGLRVVEGKDEKTGDTYPYIVGPGTGWNGLMDSYMLSADLRVEVYDYWYLRPAANAKLRFGRPTKMETWNAIFVGNRLVKNKRHPEYKGAMPYIPLFNTYIPGVPDGKAEFWDIEQLIREKDEKISENSQIVGRAVNGQFWQVTGENAPNEVSPDLKPIPNKIISSGPGNRIESIEPWLPEFPLETYLSRLDRELVDASGLNDLIRGMAPAQVMNSGKAIAALVANYETRIRMKRELYYQWREQCWDLATVIWAAKNTKLERVLRGRARLEQLPPSLVPRDDMEAASIAVQLKTAKLWSAKRGMDRVGVDDPETEEDIIRDEQTDATINPAAVQVMAQLLMVLRNAGLGIQPELTQQVAAQAGSLSNVRALGGGVGGGSPAMNQPGQQVTTPPEMMPGNTPEGAALGLGPTPGAEDLTLQTAIREGEANSRILQQQQLTQQEQ